MLLGAVISEVNANAQAMSARYWFTARSAYASPDCAVPEPYPHRAVRRPPAQIEQDGYPYRIASPDNKRGLALRRSRVVYVH